MLGLLGVPGIFFSFFSFLLPDFSLLDLFDFCLSELLEEVLEVLEDDFELWLASRNPIAVNDLFDKCANWHVSSS